MLTDADVSRVQMNLQHNRSTAMPGLNNDIFSVISTYAIESWFYDVQWKSENKFFTVRETES